MNMEFEWDEAKRRSNLAKHGVDFIELTIITPSIFQDKPGVSQNLHGINKIDAMLGQIAPALGFVPFEFHIHSNSIL